MTIAKPVRSADQSYSPVGNFAHQHGIAGVKHDFSNYYWRDGKLLWRIVSDKRLGQQLTEGHMDHLEELQRTLQAGGHPLSQVMVVWMDSSGTPRKCWTPGMGSKERKPVTEAFLEAWLRGNQ